MALTDRNGMVVRIAANIEELKRTLADGTLAITTTTSAMEKLASGLSGSKLEQRAHNIVAAINEIGGVTKLTDAEARRHLTTLDAWVAKGDLLGKKIPAALTTTRDELRKIVDASEKLPPKTIDWRNALTSVAGLMGVTFSAGAVIAFGKHVFDSASQIHDMGEKLGISTDAVQGFKFAAEQSGATLDTVGTAINKMNDNLAGGDKATVQALKNVGLSFEAIRSMRPEDAFLAITDAIQKIPDPMVQADTAMALFGKSASDLLPAIKEGFRGVAASAMKMSEETIDNLEAAQDAWDRLGTKVTIVTGTIISKALDAASRMTSSWKAMLLWADNAIKYGAGAATGMAAAEEEATRAAAKNRDVLLTLPPVIKKASDAHKEHARVIKEEIVPLAPEVQHAIDLMALAHQHETAQLQFSEAAWKQWEGTVAKALGNIQSSPVLLQGRDLSGLVPQIGAAAQSAGNLAGVALGGGASGPGFFASIFGSSAQLGQQLSATILGAIQGGGNPVTAAAGVVGSQVGSNIAKSLTKEGGKLFQTALGGVLSSALPVVGSLIAPLASALWNHLFGTAGRDKVKDFAASLGGFDELHKKLNELGAEGEQLWIKLTQGVGRNDPKAAQAAVDAVTAALERHKTAVDDAAAAATAAGDAEAEAMKKAQAAVDEITGKIQSLQDSIKDEAPEEVMGIVEANTRAQMDALVKQRDAAQAAINDTTTAAADAAEQAGNMIDAALAAREFHIRVKVNLDGLPGNSEAIPMAAGGDFWVTKPTLFLAGEAGPERATFSGGGADRPPALGGPGDGGGGDIYLTTQTILDGKVLDERTERIARRAAATGRLRPRATSGRSY